MPVGYLFTVALMAVVVLAAVAPVRHPPILAAASYRLGLVPNEIPFLAFCYLLAATALAAGQGDLDSLGGWAGSGLATLTAAGLTVVVLRGSRARPAIERAMTDGLGTGWRETIDPDIAPRPRRLPWVHILLLPMVRRRHDVKRVANQRYGDAGWRNRLDVYHHRARPRGGPILIHLHGGHYTRGHKNSQSLPLLYRLASQGWVCVSANYRLRPAVGFPDHLIDAKRIIAWVREHANEYGADPAVLVLAGSSAGAHLTALAALTPGDPAFQPGFEDTDTTINAAVCLNGYYGGYFDHPYTDLPSSPHDRLRADAPPFLIVHGDRDTVVPVEEARHFATRLRDTSTNPVVYAELPGAQHAFDLFHSVRFEAVVDAVEAFAAWTRTPRTIHQSTPS